jgi:cytochrome c
VRTRQALQSAVGVVVASCMAAASGSCDEKGTALSSDAAVSPAPEAGADASSIAAGPDAAGSDAAADSAPDASAAPRVLVFDDCIPPPLGYCHASIPAGAQALSELGAAEGMTVDVSSDPGVFTPDSLARYAVVVFLSTDVMNGALQPFEAWDAGPNPNWMGTMLSASQKAAFEQYMSRGGAYLGIHSATDGDYYWPFYVDMLGAMFTDHSSPGVYQTASLVVEDPTHPATAGLPSPWIRADEWYDFDRNPRDVARVLLRIDESTYDVGPKACVTDHPLAWCRVYQGSRVFYTALGHTTSSYAEPLFLAHLRGALRWTAGLDEGDCTPRPAPQLAPPIGASCGATPCYPGCRCVVGDAAAPACQSISGHDGFPPPNCGAELCSGGCSCADPDASACGCP